MSVTVVGYDNTKLLNTTVSGSSLSGSLNITQYDILGYPQGGGGFDFDTTMVANTPPATPTDICCIQGSNFSTIYVTRLRLHTTQNTGSTTAWFLIKRRTPNVGGTLFYLTSSLLGNNEMGIRRESNASSQSFDNLTGSFSINCAQPQATVWRYTANPSTLGNAVGIVRNRYMFSAPVTAGSGSVTTIWDFDDFQSNPIVLRGSNESLCLNFNGATLPAGLSVTFNITWKELPPNKSFFPI